MMRSVCDRRSLFSILAALLLSACGGGGGSPTAPSATPTKIIAISGSLAFGDVLVGTSRDLTITVSNSGNTAITFTGITATGGLTTHSTASPNTGIVPAGGSLPILFRFTPTTSGAFSGTITLTSDHTSGTNTVAMSGTGTVPTFSVVGVVRDAASSAPLGGVTVRVTAGVGANQTGTTDGNGYYSIPGVAGSITLSFSASGYDTASRTTTVSADTRFDTTVSRSAPVAPALEYRVTGSRASLTYSNCSGGTSQVGAATLPWSFTCTSIPSGQFLYISAQNTGDSGTVSVAIYKRGVLYRESSSTGAFVIATASGSY